MLVRVAMTDKLRRDTSVPSSQSRSWQSVQQHRRGVSIGSNHASSTLNKDHELYEMSKVGHTSASAPSSSWLI